MNQRTREHQQLSKKPASHPTQQAAEIEELRRQLHAETSERQRLEEALRHSQRLEAMGQLTGGVAHDFNNLLTVILTGVDAVQRLNLNADRKQKYLDAIGEAASRATDLTSQLLAFARRQPSREVVFDASDKTRRVMDMLVPLLGSRISLSADIDASPRFVKADPVQFETALINLAVNARDAVRGEGAIHISVDVGCKMGSEDRTAQAAKFVRLSVTDSGVGLAASELDRIFEPFYTTKAPGKGTGLGLSQVCTFAKQSGGDVQVKSREGEGAAFTLYLPEASVEQAPKQHQRVFPAEHRGGGNILVVEDSEIVGSHTSLLLCDLGFSASLVPDASSALDLLKKDHHAFDLVLTDFEIPGVMTGVDLAVEISTAYPSLPVILTTGFGDDISDSRACSFPLLRKPYTIEAFSSALAHMVASHDQQATVTVIDEHQI